MREEGCVGGDVTARVGSPHAHRRGEPDGALGDVRVVAPHRSGPTPRLDGVQPTASAATTGRCYLPLRQTARFFPIAESRARPRKNAWWHRRSQPPAPMVTKQPAFKDAASAAEVSRWMEMQAAVSRSTSRHSKVLESVLNPGSVPEPDAAPVNPLLPRWSRTLPPQPLRVTRNPEYESIDDPETDAALARVQAEANDEVPVGAALTQAPDGDEESEAKEPMTYANRIATEFMGVDPTTGKQNRVSYDGMGGIKTHYMEIYNSVGDPKNKDVMGRWSRLPARRSRRSRSATSTPIPAGHRGNPRAMGGEGVRHLEAAHGCAGRGGRGRDPGSRGGEGGGSAIVHGQRRRHQALLRRPVQRRRAGGGGGQAGGPGDVRAGEGGHPRGAEEVHAGFSP